MYCHRQNWILNAIGYTAHVNDAISILDYVKCKLTNAITFAYHANAKCTNAQDKRWHDEKMFYIKFNATLESIQLWIYLISTGEINIRLYVYIVNDIKPHFEALHINFQSSQIKLAVWDFPCDRMDILHLNCAKEMRLEFLIFSRFSMEKNRKLLTESF